MLFPFLLYSTLQRLDSNLDFIYMYKCSCHTILCLPVFTTFSEVPQVPEGALQCKTVTWPLPSAGAESHVLAHSSWHDSAQDKAWFRGSKQVEGV